MEQKASTIFFQQDALAIAQLLLGQKLVRRFDDGYETQFTISEVEVYRGEDDLGCHASKGRTSRTEVMYHQGGVVYVYFVYGMYWMLNVVTGNQDSPQAILIRGCKEVKGPGRLGRALALDKSFYGEDLTRSQRLWILIDDELPIPPHVTSPRVGIDYAGDYWRDIPWRYSLL